MIAAITREILLRQDYLPDTKIQSIYFGGGTPSILTAEQLDMLFDTIHKNFKVSENIEITLEANPDDITPEKLSIWHNCGINRLSVGIQSFHEQVLTWMNRAHNAEQALQCLQLINDSDINNYSADLIYGVPISDNSLLLDDLEKLISFNPSHISAYCLTIEPKTVFGHALKNGKLEEVSEDTAASQFLMINEQLTAHNYLQYEVSNYCKPGYESFHNNNYWQGIPYLGLGPGAHSFNGKNRHYSVSNNAIYLKKLKENELALDTDYLLESDRINEYIMTSLRTASGLSFERLKNKYEHDYLQKNNDLLKRWQAAGLCEINNEHLQLTLKGMLLADKLAADTFLVDW